jgi:signal transduction histidine kinase
MTSNYEKTTDDECQLRAEAELFHLHFMRWRHAIVGAIALIAAVGGAFLYLTQNVALWWWLALQTGAYLLQAVFCQIYERKLPQPGSSEFSRWNWIWTLLTALTGLISGSIIFFIPAEQLGLLLVGIMISGTFAIGEAFASGHERLVFAAVISQALMTCIALVLHVQMPLAVIACVIFAAVLLHFGRELNRAMCDSIVQRLRTQQLAAQLEQDQQRLLEAQHQQSVLLERQRVMQDMHDGLGSALSSSLVLLEQGEVTVAQAAVVMRECVDDLRLVVDSLEPTSKDISTLLGMLRYRLQHRLDAAGVRLYWQMADLPALNWLDPSLALDLLRLTQEAIANALKHGAATELTLTAQQKDNTIELVVHDNGCGFDVNTVTLGRGLRSQTRRAERLGSELKVYSMPGSGTFLYLQLPVNREQKP